MHDVAIVSFDGSHSLDFAGPWEVFSAANQLLGGRVAYRMTLVAAGGLAIRTHSSLTVQADACLRGYRRAIDTLLIAGGEGVRQCCQDETFVASIRRLANKSARVGSVCTGALALAQAGLLDGRRAATHWMACDELRTLHPQVMVDSDSIYVRDGKYWTSAGVTSGIDMSLAMVELDHGHAVANAVARELLVFLRRPGGQSQFSVASELHSSEQQAIRDLQHWIIDHLDGDLSVRNLAKQACMSDRNFARVFVDEVGQTPAHYIRRLRVETARRLLEQTDFSVQSIASQCGFGSELSMRRAFDKNLGVSPRQYRQRFRSQ